MAVALLAVGGCGLKGPLQMPAKSTNVVIRGPGTVDPAPRPGDATPVPEAPGDEALPEEEERLPPPPLPEGNPGAARGA